MRTTHPAPRRRRRRAPGASTRPAVPLTNNCKNILKIIANYRNFSFVGVPTFHHQVLEDDAGDDDVELFDAGEIADMDDEIGDVPANLPEKMEWLLVDEVVNASLHKLNSLLFDQNSSFMQVHPAHLNLRVPGRGF